MTCPFFRIFNQIKNRLTEATMPVTDHELNEITIYANRLFGNNFPHLL